MSLSFVAALAAGVLLGLVSSRRALSRRLRTLIEALFATAVASTLFLVGLSSGVIDYAVLPLALLYAVASSMAAFLIAHVVLKRLVGV